MATQKKKDPCWSGYHQVGTKKKNGKTVPNCVKGGRTRRKTKKKRGG